MNGEKNVLKIILFIFIFRLKFLSRQLKISLEIHISKRKSVHRQYFYGTKNDEKN